MHPELKVEVSEAWYSWPQLPIGKGVGSYALMHIKCVLILWWGVKERTRTWRGWLEWHMNICCDKRRNVKVVVLRDPI